MNKILWIIGTRGIPASHGGFETFAEKFAVHMHSKGWQVKVFCQHDGSGETNITDWNGIECVNIYSRWKGPLGTLSFDFKSILYAAKSRQGIALVLGYNSAIFNCILRLAGLRVAINMDGFEWKRNKWSWPYKCWFYINERLGAIFANHLVLDHPEIEDYFSKIWPRRPMTMIPYGGERLDYAEKKVLDSYSLEEYSYYLLIARPEPENSILDIVRAYISSDSQFPLVVLGNYHEDNRYHQKVLKAAENSKGIRFLSAIYDENITYVLRYFCRAYLHGHTVGGTNPSLVEALAAGSPVIAHNNRFNRWVAGDDMRYFDSIEQASEIFSNLSHKEVSQMRTAANKIWQHRFTWQDVLQQYEMLITGIQK